MTLTETRGVVVTLRVRLPDGSMRTFTGREAWALSELHGADPSGCTPITYPGPRWSAYVLKLRQAGLEVETVFENHGGAFAGHHGRYALRTPVEVIEEVAA